MLNGMITVTLSLEQYFVKYKILINIFISHAEVKHDQPTPFWRKRKKVEFYDKLFYILSGMKVMVTLFTSTKHYLHTNELIMTH